VQAKIKELGYDNSRMTDIPLHQTYGLDGYSIKIANTTLKSCLLALTRAARTAQLPMLLHKKISAELQNFTKSYEYTSLPAEYTHRETLQSLIEQFGTTPETKEAFTLLTVSQPTLIKWICALYDIGTTSPNMPIALTYPEQQAYQTALKKEMKQLRKSRKEKEQENDEENEWNEEDNEDNEEYHEEEE